MALFPDEKEKRKKTKQNNERTICLKKRSVQDI